MDSGSDDSGDQSYVPGKSDSVKKKAVSKKSKGKKISKAKAAKAQNKTPVKSACLNCRKSKVACDDTRPCKRCIRRGQEASCIDVKHKKRGRKTAGNADEDEADAPQARPAAKSKRQKAAPSRFREDDVEYSTGGKFRPGTRRPTETSDGEEEDDAGLEDEEDNEEEPEEADGDGDSDEDEDPDPQADRDAEEEAPAADQDEDTAADMPQAQPRSGRRGSIPLLITALEGMEGDGVGRAGGKLHGSSSLESFTRSTTPHAPGDDDGHESKTRVNGSLVSSMLSPSDHFGLGKRRRPSDPNLLAYTSSTGRRLSRASVLSPNHLDEHNDHLVITTGAWDLADESHLQGELDLSHDLPPDFGAGRRQSVESLFPMGRRGSLSNAFKFPPHSRFASRSGSITGLLGPSPTPTSPTPHTSTSPSPRHIRSPSPGHSLLPASTHNQHDASHNSNLLHPPTNVGAGRSPGAVTHSAAHTLGIASAQHPPAVMAAVPVSHHQQPGSAQAATVLPTFAVPSGRVTPTWPAVTPATVLRAAPGVTMATPVPANVRQVRFSTVISASDGTHHLPNTGAAQPRPVMAAIPVQLTPSPGSNLYTPIPKKSPSPGIAVATPVSAVPIVMSPPSDQHNPYQAALTSARYAEPSPPPTKPNPGFKAPSNNATVLHSPQRGKASGSSSTAGSGPTHITHSIAPTITYSAVLPNALTNSATPGSASNYSTSSLPLPSSSSSPSAALTPAQVRSLSPALPPPPTSSATSHSPSPFISSVSPLSHTHSTLPIPVQRAISPSPSAHAHNLLPSSFTSSRSFSPLPRTISPLVRTISPVPNSGTSSDSHMHLLGSRAISPAPLGLLRGFSPVSHTHPLSPNSSLLRAVSPSLVTPSPAHSTSPILGAAKRRRSINTISEIQAVLGMTDLARAPSRSNTPSLDEKKPKEEKKESDPVKAEPPTKPTATPGVKIGSAFTPLASAASATLPSSLEISLPPASGPSQNGGPSSSPNTSSRSISDGSTDSQVKSEHRTGGGGGGGIVPSDSMSSLSGLSGGASPPSGFVSPSGGTSTYASFSTTSSSDFSQSPHAAVSVTVPNGHSNLSNSSSAPIPSSSGSLSLKTDSVQPMDITPAYASSASSSSSGSLHSDLLAPLSSSPSAPQSSARSLPSLSAFSAAFASSNLPTPAAYTFTSSSSATASSSASSTLLSFADSAKPSLGTGPNEGGERVVLDTLLPADFGAHLSPDWQSFAKFKTFSTSPAASAASSSALWGEESDNDNDCAFHDIDGSDVRPSPHSCCAMATTHAVSNHPMGLQREIAVMQQARARARRLATASPDLSHTSETECSSAVSEEVAAIPKQMSAAPATALGSKQAMKSLEYLHYCSEILFEKLSQTQNVDNVPLPVLWFYRYFSNQFAYFLSEHPLSTLLQVVAESGAANQKTRDRVLRVLEDDYKHLAEMKTMIPPTSALSTPVSSEFDTASNAKLQVEQRVYDDLSFCALVYPLYPVPFERPPWVNEHMARTLGYSREEILKLLSSVNTFLNIFESPTRITQDFQESIFRLRKHLTCRQTLVTKDGKHLHCLCSQRYTYLDDGTPYMLQCFYQPDPSARHPDDRPDTALEKALKEQSESNYSA